MHYFWGVRLGKGHYLNSASKRRGSQEVFISRTWSSYELLVTSYETKSLAQCRCASGIY